MFFDGELRSSVRILHGSENLGFCCCATPIIMASMPKFATYRGKVERIILLVKSRIGILKENNVFRCASSEVLTAVL